MLRRRKKKDVYQRVRDANEAKRSDRQARDKKLAKAEEETKRANKLWRRE